MGSSAPVMRSFIAILAGACLSGTLLALALPPAGFGWIGWFALVPLFVSVRKRGALVGFAAGLLMIAVTTFWALNGLLYSARYPNENTSWTITGCAFFGFIIQIAAAAWADDRIGDRPIWVLASIATLGEAALLIQLPAHLSLTQYSYPHVLKVVAVGGVWTLSWLMWAANFWLARHIDDRKMIKWHVAIGISISCAILWGYEHRGGGLAVAALQTNSQLAEDIGPKHLKASSSPATMVVWPEFAGIDFVRKGDATALVELSKQPGSAGIVTSFPVPAEPLPYNAAMLVDDGVESARYYKRMLFGGEVRMHKPGRYPVKATNGPFVVGLNVCFDSCYPWVIRETARLEGVQMIALPTIDPESPHHFIAAIHAAFTPIRAAESGISIVRADGNAYSMIAHSDGTIAKLAPPGETWIASTILPPRWTLAKVIGDLPIAILLAALLGRFFRQLRHSGTSSGRTSAEAAVSS